VSQIDDYQEFIDSAARRYMGGSIDIDVLESNAIHWVSNFNGGNFKPFSPYTEQDYFKDILKAIQKQRASG
jgi:hypothetical protein